MQKTFKTPTILAIVTLIGLFSALIGDSLLDWLSWLLLAVPIVVISYKLIKPFSIKNMK